jgi:CxxC motif-containing protein
MIANGEEKETEHVHNESCPTGCSGHNHNETKAESGIKIEKKTVDIENAPVASPPPLTWKEAKALKKSKYAKKKDNYDKAFIIRNVKTGQIVELNALNAFQAAGYIGWRPRHVETLEVIDLKERNNKIKEAETLNGSSNNSDNEVTDEIKEEKE